MKVYDDKHIKNIVLLGSVKSGKTTLAETMVFEAGLTKRRGTVEDKNSSSSSGVGSDRRLCAFVGGDNPGNPSPCSISSRSEIEKPAQGA